MSAGIRKLVGGITAAEKRLATSLQRLELLVEFTNLAERTQPLSPEDVEHWNAELYALTIVSGHQPHPSHRKTASTPLGLSANQLASLSTDLRANLDRWLAGGLWVIPIENLRALLTSPRHGPPRASYAGELGPILMMASRDLLAREARRIARCAGPDCSRLLVRRKRGAYCSTRCSQRARTLRHRASFSEEEWRERRHVYYEKKLRKKKGADKLKVRRNRRLLPVTPTENPGAKDRKNRSMRMRPEEIGQ